MKVRRFILPFLVLLFLVGWQMGRSKGAQEAKKTIKKKPNIIYILPDLWSIASIGYVVNEKVKIPHLDNFVRGFVNFISTVSVSRILKEDL